MPRQRKGTNTPINVFDKHRWKFAPQPEGMTLSQSDLCWIWQRGYNSSKLPVMSIGGRMFVAYRVAYAVNNSMSVDDIPTDVVIRHKCDNPKCINPRHLELGSHQENMNDMVERDRAGGKLSNAQKGSIVKLYNAGKHTQQQIADIFNLKSAFAVRYLLANFDENGKRKTLPSSPSMLHTPSKEQD